MNNRWLWTGLRWVVGAVFLYAGVLKLRTPLDFADSIASFQVLPATLVNFLALGLPPFEILTGALLLTGWNRRAALLAVLGMTAVFAVALGSALARGLNVDCGCFGGGKPSAWKTWMSLVRDVGLFAVAGALYWREMSREKNREGLGEASLP